MKNENIQKFNVPTFSDAIMTLIGTGLCGIGVGIANYANLGLDAIGVLYDGIRCFLGLSSEQLGYAIYFVNAVIIIFLWFTARKYVSIGTLLNFLGYGICTNWGTLIMEHIIKWDALWIRVLLTTLGLLILYFGIAVYLAVDTGLDSFSGLIMLIAEKTHKDYKIVKIGFDVVAFLLGAALGGSYGIVTVVAAFVGGPVIQHFTIMIEKWYFRGKIKKMD